MKHLGFKGAVNKVAAKEGVSKKSAAKMVAVASRGATAKAKRKNPRLKKVK